MSAPPYVVAAATIRARANGPTPKERTVPKTKTRPKPDMPDSNLPVGTKEIAEFLGVQRATVQQWGFRRLLPPPDFEVNGQRAWKMSTIARWAVDTDRLDADSPRTIAALGQG